jgi:hypothetical protein
MVHHCRLLAEPVPWLHTLGAMVLNKHYNHLVIVPGVLTVLVYFSQVSRECVCIVCEEGTVVALVPIALFDIYHCCFFWCLFASDEVLRLQERGRQLLLEGILVHLELFAFVQDLGRACH